MTERASVVGVGLVPVDRYYRKSVKDLAAEAAFKAMEEAGWDSVDYVVVASSLSYLEEGQMGLAGHIAGYLGLRGARVLAVEEGEASGLAAVGVASSLIASHAAEKVLVVGVDKLTEYVSSRVYRDLQRIQESEVEALYNLGHAGVAALLMRLYMREYNVDRETMSYWPALMHSNAKSNPYAMLKFAIDPKAVASALTVADPITLLDSFPLGDGAAAVALSASETTGSDRSLARIIAWESAAGYPSPAMSDNPLVIESVARAASKLHEALGVSPSDVDVIELHDSFTITAMLLLESLGLSRPGRAAFDVAEGVFAPGGRIAVNPSGGLKARGHPIGATGVYMVAELAMQLAGVFPGVKIDDARRGLAVQVNGFGSSAHIVLLEGVA